MKHITAISDNDLKLSIELSPEKTVEEYATDLVIMWDECTGDTISGRYKSFCSVLSERWGVPVNTGTAILVIEQSILVVTDLKKTHIA